MVLIKIFGKWIELNPMEKKANGQTVTVTFSNRIEEYSGPKEFYNGTEDGYSITELQVIERRLQEAGFTCELIELHKIVVIDESIKLDEAGILVIRNGVDLLARKDIVTDVSTNKAENLFRELTELEWDKKGRSRQHKKVVNKRARYNLTFSEQERESNYEAGEGRIVSWSQVPLLDTIQNNFGKWFGDKAKGLFGEGNHYYDVKKTGLKMHGDNWRKIVIALRVGETFPLHFQWYLRSKEIGKRVTIELNNGDMYIMSEKAVGSDWIKKRTIPTLRHAAGFPKMLKLE